MKEIHGEATIYLEGMYSLTDLKEAIEYLKVSEKRGKELKADMKRATEKPQVIGSHPHSLAIPPSAVRQT